MALFTDVHQKLGYVLNIFRAISYYFKVSLLTAHTIGSKSSKSDIFLVLINTLCHYYFLKSVIVLSLFERSFGHLRNHLESSGGSLITIFSSLLFSQNKEVVVKKGTKFWIFFHCGFRYCESEVCTLFTRKKQTGQNCISGQTWPCQDGHWVCWRRPGTWPSRGVSRGTWSRKFSWGGRWKRTSLATRLDCWCCVVWV